MALGNPRSARRTQEGTAVMHEGGESDSLIVPEKQPNNMEAWTLMGGYGDPYTGTQVETPETAKGEPKVLCRGDDEMAEVVEGRGLAKGSLGGCNRDRTQCRDALQQALDWVRQAAREVRLLLTALWHQVYDIDRLREAYYSVNRRAAPGVDGETWAAYGGDLEANLRDLSGRLKRGGYHAQPVERVYIPKPDGRERPIGIPTLEDKIVQRATVGRCSMRSTKWTF